MKTNCSSCSNGRIRSVNGLPPEWCEGCLWDWRREAKRQVTADELPSTLLEENVKRGFLVRVGDGVYQLNGTYQYSRTLESYMALCDQEITRLILGSYLEGA